MRVLVTGATGTVGREVVRALLERGAEVRAMSREPGSADLPAGVEVVRGDLTDPASLRAALEGVEAAHLITFDAARGAGGGEAIADATGVVDALIDADVRRITVLQNGYPGPIEEAVADAPFEATVLMPVEFMANALDWADAIREHGRVEEPYADRLSAMVHEGDIGDVAAVALTEAGHGGPCVVTGPEVLTLRDKLDAIGEAMGRPVELVALSDAEAVERWRAEGLDDEEIGFRQWIYGDPPEVGYTVAPTVTVMTGRSGRTFAQWAREHSEAFRARGGPATRGGRAVRSAGDERVETTGRPGGRVPRSDAGAQGPRDPARDRLPSPGISWLGRCATLAPRSPCCSWSSSTRAQRARVVETAGHPGGRGAPQRRRSAGDTRPGERPSSVSRDLVARSLRDARTSISGPPAGRAARERSERASSRPPGVRDLVARSLRDARTSISGSDPSLTPTYSRRGWAGGGRVS